MIDMEREHPRGRKERKEKTEADIQLVKNMVDRLNTMSTLLYEIKAGPPLGKTMNILFNLCRYQGKTSAEGTINLAEVSLKKLAGLAGISEAELIDALDYLHRNGIIIYKALP